MKVKGVDLSYVQEGINYNALVEDDVKFAIIRLGFADEEDVTAAGHIKGCQNHGIDYGYFWYSYAMSVEEAKREAEACISAIKKHNRPNYPIFYDFEEKNQAEMLDKATKTEIVTTFCDTVIEAGYKCGVYASGSWFGVHLDTEKLKGYDIWLAHWTYNPEIPTSYDVGQTIWQWGLDIIGGMEVDGDICYVDYPEIMEKFYEEHQPKEEEKPVEEEVKPPFADGEKVKLKYGCSFSDGTLPFTFVYLTAFDIIQYSKDYSEALIGLNGNYTGWVYTKDLYSADSQPKVDENKLNKGDKVKVKEGATDYSGKPLASFVYQQVYEVIQVGTIADPDYIVIGQGGKVTAALRDDDLYKV